jgi:hypothetical protein
MLDASPMMAAKPVIACSVVLALTSCYSPPDPEQEIAKRNPSPAVELPEAKPVAPGYIARLKQPLRRTQLKAVGDARGVASLAAVRIKRIRMQGPGGAKKLRMAVVDPLAFRSVASRSIRDVEFVWAALMSGRAVITFDGAEKLGLRETDRLRLGRRSIGVGVLVEDITANIADVVVSKMRARKLKIGAPNVLIVGAKPGTGIKDLGYELKQRLPGARLRRVRNLASTQDVKEPDPPPKWVGQASYTPIGALAYRVLPNGFIDPDDAWVAANITTAPVPILGSVTCHRMLIPQLINALIEIEDAGLASQIRPGDYGGCFVPRFIDRNPRRGLSMHAFGLAIDLNVSTNGYGRSGDMHPGVARILEKWGFEWGGRWSPPDPMHFELARIVARS